MLVTYNIRHGRDLSGELVKAMMVDEHALRPSFE
jgi:hypothetical protein